MHWIHSGLMACENGNFHNIHSKRFAEIFHPASKKNLLNCHVLLFLFMSYVFGDGKKKNKKKNSNGSLALILLPGVKQL